MKNEKRLIDANGLLELYDMGKELEEYAGVLQVPILVIRQNIKDMPTVDAVEVVRCQDCKHSKLPAVLTQRYGEPGTLTCHNWHSPCNKRNVKQNDFCSYGERKDNELQS